MTPADPTCPASSPHPDPRSHCQQGDPRIPPPERQPTPRRPASIRLAALRRQGRTRCLLSPLATTNVMTTRWYLWPRRETSPSVGQRRSLPTTQQRASLAARAKAIDFVIRPATERQADGSQASFDAAAERSADAKGVGRDTSPTTAPERSGGGSQSRVLSFLRFHD